MKTIKIRITLPKCPHCRDFIVKSFDRDKVLKSTRIDSSGNIEFTYDEKANPAIDNYKYERELKKQVSDLGYTVR